MLLLITTSQLLPINQLNWVYSRSINFYFSDGKKPRLPEALLCWPCDWCTLQGLVSGFSHSVQKAGAVQGSLGALPLVPLFFSLNDQVNGNGAQCAHAYPQ